MEGILFGLDIGTTKVCALVGEVRAGQLRIIGYGVESSRGMRKGMIVDVGEASVAIAKAVEKAEETSGYALSRALVSMAGEHIGSTNSSGAVAVSRNGNGVTTGDIERALEAAQAVPVPHNREIVHLVPRHFRVDDTTVQQPVGMHGYRLEVEAHIVTGASTALRNLGTCADNVGIEAEEFVLNALASGEAVLEPNEREMDVIVADIGGGTTDSIPRSFPLGVIMSPTISPLACASHTRSPNASSCNTVIADPRKSILNRCLQSRPSAESAFLWAGKIWRRSLKRASRKSSR
jgi:cell division protein FtsA